MFCKNIGTLDRVLRIIIGLALLSLVFIGPKTVWGYIGLVLIITAFINFCPIYGMFKLNTAKPDGFKKSP